MAKQLSKIGVQLQNLSPLVNGKPLYQGISANIAHGKSIAVMGVSGIGKSLLLKSILGEWQHSGSKKINGNLFMVFQDQDQLFPWMTVEKNLNFALIQINRKQLQLWGVDHLLKLMPYQLSVGQKQKITLLRALLRNETILLCDEPLSGVDNISRIKIAKEFKFLASKIGKTVIWVTHDVLEAKQIGDQIMILNPNNFKIVKNTIAQNEILSKIQ
jgi:ABC-type nitrate/sulfonate/bicarbonate transport system ATPase subunit